MIIGNMNQLGMAMLPTPLLQLLQREECSHQHLLTQQDGKFDIIENDVFYLISNPTTAPEDSLKSEFHDQFIDIQILLCGQEIIATSAAITSPYSYQETKPDLIFIDQDEITNRILLSAGDFAIFYPGEVHRPTCQVNTSEKIKKPYSRSAKRGWPINKNIKNTELKFLRYFFYHY